MNVLVVAATEFEILPFIKENNQADVLITGVGIPAAMYNLAHKFFIKKYDMAIQAGIGGAFSSLHPLGSVVAVAKDTYGDLGIHEKNNFSTLFDAGFTNSNVPPFENGWLVNNSEMIQTTLLEKSSALTVNKITDDVASVKMLQEKFNAGVESMEGAAFHEVCIRQQVNFLQLRSISNKVGERDKTKWKMKEAINNLNNELKKIIEHIYR